MNIPDVESFIVKDSIRDKYGKVTSVVETIYYGVIERQTQFRGGSAITYLGEGIVFSSNIQGKCTVGQEIIIDLNIFTIVQVLELKDLEGNYHHTELFYG